MRLHYFDRPAPDPDDASLRRAVEEDRVPYGCLLGGAALEAILGTGRDPCASCLGPRPRCGGRASSFKDRHESDKIRMLFTGSNANLGALERLLRQR